MWILQFPLKEKSKQIQMNNKTCYSEENISTDSAILSFIVLALLPNSRKEKLTTFEDIMDSNLIRNFKTSREDVMRLLTGEYCRILFYSNRVDWENYSEETKSEFVFRIDHNYFYSDEERADPNYMGRLIV
ncbi:MAG: hypothetical protein ACXVNM_11860 [Bacteroidia bacterium]